MKSQLAILAFLLCPVSVIGATPNHTTQIVIVKDGRTSTQEMELKGPLQVKADASQSGPTPKTTTLKGHVTLTIARKQGSLTLTADQATVESQLIEVQIHASNPLNTIGEDMGELSDNLKKFPSAPAFRITWDVYAGGFSSWTTELYQRQEQKFSVYSFESTELGVRTTREFYTHVQDDAIHQVAAQFEGTPKNLTSFGAVYDRQKSYRLRPRVEK